MRARAKITVSVRTETLQGLGVSTQEALETITAHVQGVTGAGVIVIVEADDSLTTACKVWIFDPEDELSEMGLEEAIVIGVESVLESL